jgi:hypothetical protein
MHAVHTTEALAQLVRVNSIRWCQQFVNKNKVSLHSAKYIGACFRPESIFKNESSTARSSR